MRHVPVRRLGVAALRRLRLIRASYPDTPSTLENEVATLLEQLRTAGLLVPIDDPMDPTSREPERSQTDAMRSNNAGLRDCAERTPSESLGASGE